MVKMERTVQSDIFTCSVLFDQQFTTQRYSVYNNIKHIRTENIDIIEAGTR